MGEQKLIFLTHPYKLQSFEILSHNCERKPNILWFLTIESQNSDMEFQIAKTFLCIDHGV